MKYYKIDSNNIVVQVQPDYKAGFKKDTTDKVICGMVDNGDGTFSVPSPTQEQLKVKRMGEIDARLAAIDVESIRPLRAINNGTSIQADIDKLASLDTEADALRTERATLVV